MLNTNNVKSHRRGDPTNSDNINWFSMSKNRKTLNSLNYLSGTAGKA